MLYANANHDAALVGHIDDEFQWNYTVNYATSSSAFVTHMGLLIDARLLQSPKTFFCPSESDPQWQFDTDLNPWPIVTIPSADAHHTRLGFGTRPGASWSKDGKLPDPMPRLTRMKSKAIIADLLIGPTYVKAAP